MQEGTWVTVVTGYMGDSSPTDMGDKHNFVVVPGMRLQPSAVAKMVQVAIEGGPGGRLKTCDTSG